MPCKFPEHHGGGGHASPLGRLIALAVVAGLVYSVRSAIVTGLHVVVMTVLIGLAVIAGLGIAGAAVALVLAFRRRQPSARSIRHAREQAAAETLEWVSARIVERDGRPVVEQARPVIALPVAEYEEVAR